MQALCVLGASYVRPDEVHCVCHDLVLEQEDRSYIRFDLRARHGGQRRRALGGAVLGGHDGRIRGCQGQVDGVWQGEDGCFGEAGWA